MTSADMRVTASIASDDGECRGTFSAAAWFAGATDGQIRELAAAGWSDSPADEVAYHCEECPAVSRVFEHVLSQPVSFDRLNDLIIGFEVKINGREAMLWLRENRYQLWLILYHQSKATPPAQAATVAG